MKWEVGQMRIKSIDEVGIDKVGIHKVGRYPEDPVSYVTMMLCVL